MAQKKWDDLSVKEKARVLREYGKDDPAYANAYSKLTDEQLVNSQVLWPRMYTDDGRSIPPEQMGDAYIGELAAGRTAGSNPDLKDPDAPRTQGAVSDITGVGGPGGTTVDDYDPLRGLSSDDKETFSGVRPGVVLDDTQYARDGVGTAALGLAAQTRLGIQNRSNNPDRYAIDPNAVPTVDPLMVDTPRDIRADSVRTPNDIRATTINAAQTDVDGAFDATRGQVDSALGTVNNVMSASGQAGMRSASDMAQSAALGLTPSQSEQLFLNAGAEGKAAYDRIAMQSAIEARNRTNQLRQQQNSLAAGQRGAVSGLANLQAMNNTALGQAQIAQAALDTQRMAGFEGVQAQRDAQYRAAAGRADEMAQSRALYAQIETALRSGNIQAAGELAKLAGVTLSADGQILAARQDNTQQMNAARTQNAANNLTAQQATAANQINVGTTNAANSLTAQQATAANQLTAGTANASNSLAAGQTNAGNALSVLQGNQGAAVSATSQDDAAKQAYDSMILGESEADRQARILAEQNRQQVVDQQADRLANIYTGNATTSAQMTAAREQRESQQTAAAVGAIGTIGAAVISDERAKNVKGDAKPPDFRRASDAMFAKKALDFTRAKDSNYTYKGDPSKTEYRGPMAQQLPANTRERGPGGVEYVNQKRLAMNLASAVGRLQRKVGV